MGMVAAMLSAAMSGRDVMSSRPVVRLGSRQIPVPNKTKRGVRRRQTRGRH